MPSVFSRLNIGPRLIASHGLLLLLLVLVVGWCMVEFEALARRMEGIVEVSDAKVLDSQEMLNAINDMAVRVRSLALSAGTSLTNGEAVEGELAALQSALGRYAAAVAAYERIGVDAGRERDLWQAIGNGVGKTQPLLKRAADEARDGSMVAASTTLALRAGPAEQAWRGDVQALIALKTAQNTRDVDDARQAKRRALSIVSVVVVLALLVGASLSRLIARSVKRPIDQAIELAERIAAGDLSTALKVERDDELGRLLLAIATMQRQLGAMVSEIRGCADLIQRASSEVAAGNQDLSVRTESAAASLQLTSTSLGEISEDIMQSAAFAGTASELAGDAARIAQEGSQMVALVSSAMQDIHASSARVNEITGVIDAIAMQTRLLALNAAVEAARVGEHGRGFSVVAGEVRNLANRSATAAKEIGELIDSSMRQVSAGAQRAASARASMSTVVEHAQRVATTVGEISVAVAAQSDGLGKVSGAAGQLDEMTQQNAALVEQSMAAAATLHAQSNRLSTLVAAFTLAS